MINKNTEQDNFKIIIQPNRSWFHIDLQGIWDYRYLLTLLVRRDFVAKYKQTVLGPLWFVIQPLILTLVFTVIFGMVARLPTDGMPPMLFYLCGLLSWTYFANCLNATSTSLTSNASLFGKVYFPRLVVPISVVISNLFTFAIHLFTFLAFYVYFKFFTAAGADIHPNSFLFVLPLLLLQTAVLALGVGLWLSALTAKYRDFLFLAGFLTQLWMYATPIIYPLSLVPEKWRLIAVINPMVSIVESYKHAFFGTGVIELNYLLISVGITVIIFLTGILAFNKAERTFIDTV